MSHPDRQRPIGTAAVLSLAAMMTLGLACSGDPAGQGNGCQSTGAAVTINARDNQTFDPSSATISPAETVCWQNFGAVTHTVTSDPSLPAPPDSTWNLNATLNSNTVVSKSFSAVGDYPYHCTLHPGMQGVIFVR